MLLALMMKDSKNYIIFHILASSVVCLHLKLKAYGTASLKASPQNQVILVKPYNAYIIFLLFSLGLCGTDNSPSWAGCALLAYRQQRTTNVRLCICHLLQLKHKPEILVN